MAPHTVLITGGGRRLGAAIGRGLAARGHRVILHANASIAAARALAAELGGSAVAGDLAEAGAPARIVAAATAAARAAGSPVTALVNNASRFAFDTAESATAESIAAHMAPNLIAPVLLAQEFARALGAAEGVIVNILDQKLSNLNPDFFAYTLSKAALAAATEMMAMHYAPRIRVAGVAPGLTLPGPKQSQERFERLWRANPLRRGARPEDIAAAVAFLLETPAATGTTVTVDGGEHLMRRERDVAFAAD